MDDDTDLLIAAAATAALFTWVGTRQRRGRRAAGRPRWRAWLRAVRAGVARSWREAPIYQLVKGVRDAFFRER